MKTENEINAKPVLTVSSQKTTNGLRHRVNRLWANAGIRAIVGTSGASTMIMGLNILTGMLTAHLLAPVGRGELAAVTMWPQFLGFLLALGLPTSLVYHIQGGRHDAPSLMTAAILGSAVMGALGAGIGAVLLPYALTAYAPHTVRLAQLCMLFTPFGLFVNVLSSAFLRVETIARYNYLRLATPVFTLIALVLLALAGMLTVERAALAYLLPTLPIAVWAMRKVRETIGYAQRVHWQTGRDLLLYGLRYYGAEVAGTLSAQLDRVLVVWMLTPTAMGLYVVALSVSRVVQQIPMSIATVLLPQAAASTPAEAVRMTLRAAGIAGILSIVATVPMMVFASTILSVFFGADFVGATDAFVILTVEAALGGTMGVLMQVFLAVGRPAKASLYQMIGLATVIPLLLLLGPRYGIVGISVAILISTFTRLCLMGLGIQRLYRDPNIAQMALFPVGTVRPKP